MAKLPRFEHKRDTVMIRRFSQRVRALATAADVRRVVSALAFNHADPGGAEITDIGNYQRHIPGITVRLDRQANTSSGAANLQIQVNNAALAGLRLSASEGTTIAQVLIPAEVYRTAFRCTEHNVRTHLTSVVRGALMASYDSMGGQFTVEEQE